MRKQIIYTILSGLLCTSGFGQKVQIPGEVPLVDLQSTVGFVASLAALAGDYEDARKNVTEPKGMEGRANDCGLAGSSLLDFVSSGRDKRHVREVPMWRLPDSQGFFFISGMTIDADGAPNAYNPDDTGLDELANAGTSGHWDGIITDKSGNAIIQRESDPFPGYYISCTSLSDETKHFTDPTGYVNASKIPYVVLPKDVA